MIHTLKIPVVRSVFEAAYLHIVGGKNLQWSGVEGPGNEFKFGYHVLDNAERKLGPIKLVLEDKPPYKLDGDMQVKMWTAQHDLRRKQVERLFNEIVGLINGSLTGSVQKTAKVFTFTEAELRDRDLPLMTQLRVLKDKNSELQVNYEMLLETTANKIGRLEKELEEANAAIGVLREASAAASAKPVKAKTSPKAAAAIPAKAKKPAKKKKVG